MARTRFAASTACLWQSRERAGGGVPVCGRRACCRIARRHRSPTAQSIPPADRWKPVDRRPDGWASLKRMSCDFGCMIECAPIGTTEPIAAEADVPKRGLGPTRLPQQPAQQDAGLSGSKRVIGGDIAHG